MFVLPSQCIKLQSIWYYCTKRFNRQRAVHNQFFSTPAHWFRTSKRIMEKFDTNIALFFYMRFFPATGKHFITTINRRSYWFNPILHLKSPTYLFLTIEAARNTILYVHLKKCTKKFFSFSFISVLSKLKSCHHSVSNSKTSDIMA